MMAGRLWAGNLTRSSNRRGVFYAVRFLRAALALGALAVAAVAVAEDAYYRNSFSEMQFAEGKKPVVPSADRWPFQERAWTMLPYVVLDTPGEAYMDKNMGEHTNRWEMPRLTAHHDAIVIRTSQTGKVAGRLYYPKPDWSGMKIFRFTAPLPTAQEDARQLFNFSRAEYYQRQLNRQVPGGAWFRHEARKARIAAGSPRSELQPGIGEVNPPEATFGGPSDLPSTYALFTGGRALSENLQLDRMMRTTGADGAAEATVNVNKIEGISVPEIDWKPLVKDLKPKLDPLAALDSRRSARRLLPDLLGRGANGRRGGLGGHARSAAGRAAFGRCADGETI